MTTFRMKHVDWERGLFVFAESSLQFTFDERWADLIVKHPRQSQTGLCCGDRGLICVTL